MNIRPETQKLIDRANSLRLMAVDKTAEKKRYWDTYSVLADAVSNAPDPTSLWVAQIAYKRHRDQPVPNDHNVVHDWHCAIRIALDAVGVDAGIDRSVLE